MGRVFWAGAVAGCVAVMLVAAVIVVTPILPLWLLEPPFPVWKWLAAIR
jgi:hypothetical protein